MKNRRRRSTAWRCSSRGCRATPTRAIGWLGTKLWEIYEGSNTYPDCTFAHLSFARDSKRIARVAFGA